MKVVRRTVVVGFGQPIIEYEQPTSEEYVAYMETHLGVKSWDKVPAAVRANGRENEVGRLYGGFTLNDLIDQCDVDAIRACIKAAAALNSTSVDEFEI